MRALWWMTLGGVMWLTGCATVYVPAPAHVPLLEDQGDVQLMGYTGTGTGGAAAYAVTDQVSLRAAGHKPDWTRPSYLLEGGVGFLQAFRPIDDRPEYGGRMGASLDLGGGRAWDSFREFSLEQDDEDEPRSTYDANVLSMSAQGYGGFESEYFAVGGVLRFTIQQHHLLRGTNMHPSPAPVTSYAFIEPSGFLRLGANPVFFDLQMGFSLPMSELPVNAAGFPFMIGAGLVVELGRKPEGQWY